VRPRPSAFDVVVALAGVLVLVLSLPNLPQAARAAHPDAGVHGTFIAQGRTCIRHTGHTACNWQGRFTSDDGTITLNGVSLYGDGADVRAGARTSARDVGRTGYVYLMAGSHEWIATMLFIAAGLFLIRRSRLHRLALASFSRSSPRAPAEGR
jgi:hypothetical protein